ncbi:host-nuclease inhibitor Gam family protein [Actinobacillus sp. GY-402]|nr:host-nuclease inhibitor Gam family protein [Actinobacillus sp. GY-402]
MAKKATRIKSDTFVIRYQSRDEVESAITTIGLLQRELQRKATEQNDELAAITDRYAPQLAALQDQIKPIQAAIQAWCESNRDELLPGKAKTIEFNTGSVQWRQRPPSVVLRGIDSVLEALKNRGLLHFIRVKEEVNKEAMLNEPEKAAGVPGVTIKTGVEDFVITPFEQEVQR